MTLPDLSAYFPITDPTWIFFVVLCIILFAPMILERLRIPHIIGMVLAGVLVGQYGLNVLVRDNSFELFGQVGLYYIMFTAGLGMDLGGLKKNLSHGLTFGVLTFLIPFAGGWALGLFVLDYSMMGSLLLASILASHTLVAYPIVSRYGLSRHISVTLSVGATMVALLTALLVVAGISGAYAGSGGIGFWGLLAFKCILFCVGLFVVFPPLIRFFFRRFADNVLQYIFVLSLVFLSAAMSELCGLEGIFGAFLAGLVLNRFIPQQSPLMNRIDFVGNALFIPYFLIGVGMLINVRLLFESGYELLVVSLIVLVATATKWLAAWLGSKLFRLDRTSGLMMFGLTEGHAAGALAMVMVGTQLEISPGVYLMSDEVLNAVVLLILFSCIISSLATAAAARRFALEAVSKEEDAGEDEKTLIALSNPETVDVLVNVALMMRDPKSKASFVGLNVVLDGEHSARMQEAGKLELEEAARIAAAVDVKMKTRIRLGTNVTSAIVHAMKEFEASELIIGLHRKRSLVDTFYGNLASTLFSGLSRQIIIFKSLEPVNTLRRIHVAVPAKAEFEAGFCRWLERMARLTEQLDCRIDFHATAETEIKIRDYLGRKHPSTRAEYQLLDDWDDLLMLTGSVNYDHLLVVVTARRGTLSYQSSFERLPMQIERYFSNNSLMLIFPDQFGSESDVPTSFSTGFSKDDGLSDHRFHPWRGERRGCD